MPALSQPSQRSLSIFFIDAETKSEDKTKRQAVAVLNAQLALRACCQQKTDNFQQESSMVCEEVIFVNLRFCSKQQHFCFCLFV